MALSRHPFTVRTSKAASRVRLWSAVNQFPIRTPTRLAPFTRAMPAASSGLSIGGFEGESAYRGQAQIDRGWRKPACLQFEAVAQDDRLAERQSWL